MHVIPAPFQREIAKVFSPFSLSSIFGLRELQQLLEKSMVFLLPTLIATLLSCPIESLDTFRQI